MSYQVLARKWRPRSFSSLVGQEHVVRALSHALTEGRLHHAYLFTGTRGVGKTTIARILAKSLNCERGVSASPCGHCSACLEIDTGRFVDLLEVDAATNTKVDEMRQLLENAIYAPTRGRYKVYVIDEVHMLSNSAFNAMLKTLEEPPEHVKFILATTDPQKIPVTVLSRCLQFNLKQMAPLSVNKHLTAILQAEDISFEPGALSLIARTASGSMRDALSLLDQAIAHGGGRVEEVSVRQMLGTGDLATVLRIYESLADHNGAELLSIADDIALHSISYHNILSDMANIAVRLQISSLVNSAIFEDEPDQDRLVNLSKIFKPEQLQLYYQIIIQGKDELPLAPDEYSGFVMTLLRLFAFYPSSAEAKSFLEKPPKRLPAALVAPRSSVQPSPVAEPDKVERVDVEVGLHLDNWRSIVEALELSGMAKTLAQNCVIRSLSENLCVLRLPPNSKHLLIKAAQEKLQSSLVSYLNKEMSLRIEVGEVGAATLAEVLEKEGNDKQEAAVSAINNDLFIRDAREMLDASIVPGSIKLV